MRGFQQIAFLLLALLCIVQKPLFAQFDSQSQFSYYGLGNLQKNLIQSGAAMGGTYHSIRDSNALNFANPAALSSIDVTQFVFGGEVNMNFMQGGTGMNVYLNQLGLGFPIMKRRNFGWGLHVGFSPFSQVAYKTTDSSTAIYGLDTLTVQRISQGSGGLNKVSLGNGFRIGKNFSIGVNAHFIFGTTYRNNNVYMDPGTGMLSTVVQNKVKVSAFSADAGFQFFYPIDIKKRYKPEGGDTIRRKDWPFRKDRIYITIGGTYNIGTPFNATVEQLAIQTVGNSINDGVDKNQDTLFINPSQRTSLQLPHFVGGGISFKKPNVWTVAMEFNYGIWNGFTYPSQGASVFKNSWSANAGVEFSPKFKGRETGKNRFFKNIIYRFGARYGNPYLQPDGNVVDEVAGSFGLGLPLGFVRVYDQELNQKIITSYINLGIEGGMIQSRNNGVFNQSFLRISIGITLKDQWFVKRKFN